MVVRRLPASDELSHHGILGMKWGVRRYQNADGSLTNAGKKRKGLVQTIKDKKKAKMLREAKEKKKAEREEKEAIIRSGDRKTIERNKNKLTDEEFARALDRISMSDSLKSYGPGGSNKSTADKAMSYIDRISKVALTVGNIASAANSIGTAARTFNSLKNEKSVNSRILKQLNDENDVSKLRKTIKENNYYNAQMKKGNYNHLKPASEEKLKKAKELASEGNVDELKKLLKD